MKKIFYVLMILIIIAGLGWWMRKEDGTRTSANPEIERRELCYARIENSPDSEFEDKHTLRLAINGTKTSGELRFLPAEKDALVGAFEGTVTAPGTASARAATVWWDTEGEGMTARQELSIHFDSDSAEIGLGAMKDRGDGVYVYEDPAAVDYSLSLPSIPCETLDEREVVETELWQNITTLSPIAPVLGGNWHVISATIDTETDTGTVVYEDGHVQEKRNFYYAYNIKGTGELDSLTIE